MNREPAVDTFPCSFCKKHCDKPCTKCYRVSYCCKEHEEEDFINHWPICAGSVSAIELMFMPCESNLRNWYATTDIMPGELIYIEKSLISGPFYEINQKIRPKDRPEIDPVCLSCYKKISYAYSCSSCLWPVCDLACEKNKTHANFECKVFQNHGIKPKPLKDEITLDGRNIYAMITTLRAILLRDLDPSKWQRIMNNYSYPAVRTQFNARPYWEKHLELVTEFIRVTCGMTQISEKIIERVAAIIGFTGFGRERWESPHGDCDVRTSTFLFHERQYIQKGAVSNCHFVLEHLNDSEIRYELYATRFIAAHTAIILKYRRSAGSRQRTIFANSMKIFFESMGLTHGWY